MEQKTIDEFLKDFYNTLVGEEQLKIVMLGAHGTGKSTLANALSEELDIPVVESIARIFNRSTSYIKDTFPVNEHWKAELINQEILCDASIWDFKRWKDVNAIFTRTPLDTLAYTMYGTPEWKNSKKYWDKLLQDKMDEVKNDETIINMLHNSICIYIPIEFEIEADGLRPIGKQYQMDIDENMRKLIREFELDPIVVTGSVEERKNTILGYLDENDF